MSDIQKLHKVIETLEEQSSKVVEFNGILSAVNLAKEEVQEAKAEFERFAKDCSSIFFKNFSKIQEYNEKLTSLETRILTIENIQEKTLNKLNSLSFSTPEQLNEIEKQINERLDTKAILLQSTIENYSESQIKSIKNLRKFLTFCFIAIIALLAASIAQPYLA